MRHKIPQVQFASLSISKSEGINLIGRSWDKDVNKCLSISFLPFDPCLQHLTEPVHVLQKMWVTRRLSMKVPGVDLIGTFEWVGRRSRLRSNGARRDHRRTCMGDQRRMWIVRVHRSRGCLGLVHCISHHWRLRWRCRKAVMTGDESTVIVIGGIDIMERGKSVSSRTDLGTVCISVQRTFDRRQ